MKLILRILSLIKNRASLNQYYLEIGAYFLRKGVGYKIGDPIKHKQTNNGKIKVKQYYISNLIYDFSNNSVRHTVTKNKPIKK